MFKTFNHNNIIIYFYTLSAYTVLYHGKGKIIIVIARRC